MRTGIEISTGYFPLAFILALCTPVIVINGVAWKRPWGLQYFELPPGNYQVRVYFKYLFMSHCGDNFVNVSVAPGRVTHITYNMPPWMLSKGTMRVVSW